MPVVLIAIAVALPILLMAAAVVGSSEASLFSLTYSDRLRLKRQSPRSAAAVAQLLAQPGELLVTLLFTNMVFITMFFVLTSMLLTAAANSGRTWLGIAISIFDLLAMMVFAEIASKMLAVRRRVEVATINAIPVLWLVRLLAPLRKTVVSAFIGPATRLFIPPGRNPADSRLTTEELASLLHVGQEEGAIDSDEQRVLRQVIHLHELRVRDVMTPRMQMAWLHHHATPDQVRCLARDRRLTRVPVSEGTLDDEVLGMLDVKSYLAAAQLRAAVPDQMEYLDPPHYVPERARLDKLLEQMRNWRVKVALCVDEYGATVGIVSARDIVRQMTAELTAGGSESESESRPRQVSGGKWLIPGRFPARGLTDLFSLPSDPRVSTVAGLVLSMLGRLPLVGDRVQIGNVRLTVERLAGRVVDEVCAEIVTTDAPTRAPEVGGITAADAQPAGEEAPA